MAISQKSYTEYAHSSFPEHIDDEAFIPDAEGNPTTDLYAGTYMSDIDADTLQGMNSYNNAFMSGNYTECMKLLNTEYGENKKKLKESLFNADRYNWVRDAILSIQKFFLHDVKDYMNAVVDEDLHIQRKKIYSADDKSDACTYSSRYINKMLDNEYMATLDVNN